MSDESGLTLFEDNASVAGSFPRAAMGGYQRQSVDEYLRAQEHELTRTRRRVHELEREIEELRAELAERPASVEDLDFSQLGGYSAQMLGLARDQAQEMTDEARREAMRIRGEAKRDATRLLHAAETEAADARQLGLTEVGELRARLDRDTTGEVARAREESAALIAAAQREAEIVRLRARQEAASTTEQARLAAEQTVATATRQANELRATLAQEREQAITDLRTEQEQHREKTSALLDEATQHHQAAQDRLANDVAEAARIRNAALSEAEQLKVQSLRETEERLAITRRQSQLAQERAEESFGRRKDEMRSELGKLHRRRQMMLVQLTQLTEHARGAISGYEGDDSTLEAMMAEIDEATTSPAAENGSEVVAAAPPTTPQSQATLASAPEPSTAGAPQQSRPEEQQRPEEEEPTIVMPRAVGDGQ
ncbi:DivIVA domain-containing protein [Microlunatus sp. Y2014]|uniref:DivIVA domain-containing protein n=1 Tax=Microlunatus sp. Y2014 TaxID=3418488 RepID=UPI003DA77C65